jgi:hypothetical protein
MEPDLVLCRLEYGAVPLDPWHAKDQDTGGNYVDMSTRRISSGLREAVVSVAETDWVQSPDLSEKLYDFMEVSLYDAQMRRIVFNDARSDMLDDMRGDWRIVRAIEGLATPGELLDILVDHPNLESIEMAKLTHPLDFTASLAMDMDVLEVVLSRFGGIASGEPYYKMKRVDLEIPVGIMSRKQVIAAGDTSSGLIQVVQRRSFLIRGDNGVSLDPYLARKLKNPDRLSELIEKVDSRLLTNSGNMDSAWLQPMTTSYYAKYVK